MADTGGQPNLSRLAGWRMLGAFWVAALSLMSLGAGVVQWLGPPRELEASNSSDPARLVIGAALQAPAGRSVPEPVVPATAGRDTAGPIARLDPALSEPAGDRSRATLPRIAADGRVAMRVYAAGFDRGSHLPRIGLLLAGIGMNDAESDVAIRALPAAISLAISPYAAPSGTPPGGSAASGANLTRLLETARASGHEYLVAIPMEPAGFPLNDPGPFTLLTGESAATNALNLRWALSRIDGYVGATGVVGTMRGERLAAMTDQMEAVLSELSKRGLLYVDPREGRGPVAKAWGMHVDLVIDDPADQGAADRSMVDARLAGLEQQAKDAGSALGLVMRPTPVAVARIAAWSSGLADRGLALAPVSALVLPPAETPVKLSEKE
jgi:polysaccharide deacetylase 2 family uncharacterized protein YibQ